MIMTSDDGFTSGIKVLHELKVDPESKALIEQYTITNVGAMDESFHAEVRDCMAYLREAGWFRTGITESQDQKKVIVTGTNSMVYKMPELEWQMSWKGESV